LDSLAESELTKADLARMLGKEPSQITRWLSGSGNLTLDTLSDLLFAVKGCVLDLKATDPFHPSKSNHQAISNYISYSFQSLEKRLPAEKVMQLVPSREETSYVRI